MENKNQNDNETKKLVNKEQNNKIEINVYQNKTTKLDNKKGNIIYKILLYPTKIKLNINLYVLIALIICVILYYDSLKGCYGAEFECVREGKIDFFLKRAYSLVISTIISNVIYILSIHKKISCFYSIITLCFFIINFMIHKGQMFDDHGYYNTILYLLITFIFFVFYIFSLITKFLFSKKQYFIFFLLIFIIIYSISNFFYKNSYLICKNWENGFKNTKIDNNETENLCYIRKPTKCYSYLFSIDVSKLFLIDCKNQDKAYRNYLYKMVFGNDNKENYKIRDFAIPKTQNYNYPDDFILENILNRFYRDIKPLPNNKTTEENEVTLHFDKNGDGHLNINIYRNETLIKERKEISKNNKNNIKFENVIIIFIDAISRVSFLRNLPKTSKILEKYYYANNDNKNDKIKSYQFLKYHTFGPNTRYNMIPTLYGVSFTEKGNHILNYYKSLGFITGQSADFCGEEPFEIKEKGSNKYIYNSYLNKENYDHEFLGIYCLPLFMDRVYDYKKKCLFGKENFKYNIEYGKKFLNAYKSENKFLFLDFVDAHEGTGSVAKYIDNDLSEFVEYIFNKFVDKRNLVILMSDHGLHMPYIDNLINYDNKYIEMSMGSLFIILSKGGDNNFDDSGLIKNEQKLTTPYDIHSTLMDNIGLENNNSENKGQSLFLEINGLTRNCEKYKKDFFHLSNSLSKCQCINYH